ncbi:MAG TPA: CDP-diacylglycerol--serine O-phosphatidyltransferase [Bacillota bacterium]|nr:CDP-diacylglycerol--serine O-phosphatidyltransferase [Bacillota bacterium]
MLSYIVRSIPNMFSLGNLLCGIFSITFSMNGYFRLASLLIFCSAFLDLWDGKLARKLKVSNQIGVELDSLADVVSFGVAPAILFHTLSSPSWITSLAFILYPTMGALRLARFNASPTVGYFIGIPITFAGLLMSLMGLFSYTNSVITIILALLMVSPIRIMKF